MWTLLLPWVDVLYQVRMGDGGVASLAVFRGSLLLFSCSFMSSSLRPHGLWHATRLPCPSPCPGACSNSCALSWWCLRPTVVWGHWLFMESESEGVSHPVVSDSLQPHGLQPTGLLCPWVFPGKNTGVGCHFLLQGIFLTQGLNLSFLRCRQILYREAQKLWQT